MDPSHPDVRVTFDRPIALTLNRSVPDPTGLPASTELGSRPFIDSSQSGAVLAEFVSGTRKARCGRGPLVRSDREESEVVKEREGSTPWESSVGPRAAST